MLEDGDECRRNHGGKGCALGDVLGDIHVGNGDSDHDRTAADAKHATADPCDKSCENSENNQVFHQKIPPILNAVQIQMSPMMRRRTEGLT